MNAYQIIIDMPARALGTLFGSLLHMAALIAIVGGSFYIAYYVSRRLRIPALNYACAIIVFVVVSTFLYRVEIWTAASFIKAAELTNYDE